MEDQDDGAIEAEETNATSVEDLDNGTIEVKDESGEANETSVKGKCVGANGANGTGCGLYCDTFKVFVPGALLYTALTLSVLYYLNILTNTLQGKPPLI